MPDDKSTTDDFDKYVDRYVTRKECRGVNSEGKREPFVPRVAVWEFWNKDNRVFDALCSDVEGIGNEARTILDKYLVVFSILVSIRHSIPIGLHMCISTFISAQVDDNRLPLLDTPKPWQDSDFNKQVIDKFIEAQWKFCPLDLGLNPPSNYMIPERMIIPILSKEKIQRYQDEPSKVESDDHHLCDFEPADEVSLYKVEWHRDCLGEAHVPATVPPRALRVPLVLKEYCGDDAPITTLYQNEIEVYASISDKNESNHILKYYGSFSGYGLHTIILEYADGGDLQAFMARNDPIDDPTDRHMFWTRFLGLFKGLAAIHNLTFLPPNARGRTWLLEGVHQDIRPKNILLFHGQSPNPYDVTFKFTDFGSGHVRKIRSQGSRRGASQGAEMTHPREIGNGMYIAPELYRDDQQKRFVPSGSDVWSLGALASEALVWSTQGPSGLDNYRERRIEATQATRLNKGYHEGAFHDGTVRLDLVEQVHKECLECDDDPLSRDISGIILESMLVEDERLRASAIQSDYKCQSVLAQHSQGITFTDEPDSTLDSLVGQAGSLGTRGTVGYRDGLSYHPNIAFSHSGDQAGRHSIQEDRWRRRTHDGSSHNVSHGRGYLLSHHNTNQPTHHSPLNGTTAISRLRFPDRPSAPLFSPEVSASDRAGCAWERGSSAPTTPSHHQSRQAPITPNKHRPDICITEDRPGTARGVTPTSPLSSPGSQSHNSPFSSPTSRSTNRTYPVDEAYGIPESDPETSPQHPRTSGFSLRDQDNPDTSRNRLSVASGHEGRPVSVCSHSSRDESRPLDPIQENSENRHHRRFASSRPIKVVTVDDISDRCIHFKDRKSRTRRFLDKINHSSSTTNPLNEYPVLVETLERLKGMGAREQIFLVDDSGNMACHRAQLARTVRVLSYCLKMGGVDPDGQHQLFFASNISKGCKSKDSTKLQEAIQGHKFTSHCDMATGLRRVVNLVLESQQRTTIYVLTNGHWGSDISGDFRRVDGVIDDLIGEVAKMKEPNWVGVQFIRFWEPHDEVTKRLGRERLSSLDNKFRLTDKDIVDTRDWDADVSLMLNGAVFPDEDEQE